MRKHALLMSVLAILSLLTACSAVFDAGIGGKVYYMQNGSEVAISGAKILVYEDTSFSEVIGSGTSDDRGNFTVSKIVWKTTSPKYGKTADVHTVYIKVTHEDFEMSSDYITARLVSDSTNPGMADVKMEKVRYTVPVFRGRIDSNTSDASPISETYDEVPVYICSKDGSDYIRFSGTEATVTTSSNQAGDLAIFTHGHFEGLGGGNLKYSKDTLVYIAADMDRDGEIGVGDLVSKQAYRIDESTTYTLSAYYFEEL